MVDTEKPKVETKKPLEERSVTYVPLGSTEKVELKFEFVRKYLCTPTKSGALPSDSDIVKFLKLCERQALDPWVGDAFLTGYDTWNETLGKSVATFSMITAFQALLKRAELSPSFDGTESGVVIIKKGESEPVERKGTIVLRDENLVGAWAKCFRKDHAIPHYATVQFETYNTGYSRWKKDPAGMIVKCGKASAFREAFPNHLAGLYTEEEMGKVIEGEVTSSDDRLGVQPAVVAAITGKTKTSSELANILKARNGQGVNSAAETDTVERNTVSRDPEQEKLVTVNQHEVDRLELIEADYASLMAEMADIRVDSIPDIERDIQTMGFDEPQKAALSSQLAKAKKRLGY